jgi:hypothetical protein
VEIESYILIMKTPRSRPPGPHPEIHKYRRNTSRNHHILEGFPGYFIPFTIYPNRQRCRQSAARAPGDSPTGVFSLSIDNFQFQQINLFQFRFYLEYCVLFWMSWDNPIENLSVDSFDDRFGRSASFVDLVLNSAYAHDILWIIWPPCACRWKFSGFWLICRANLVCAMRSLQDSWRPVCHINLSFWNYGNNFIFLRIPLVFLWFLLKISR